jgi:hypothetical protein
MLHRALAYPHTAEEGMEGEGLSLPLSSAAGRAAARTAGRRRFRGREWVPPDAISLGNWPAIYGQTLALP